MGRRLQGLERVEPEIVVQLPGQRLADARHGGEQGHGVRAAAQPVQHREAAGGDEVVDGAGQARADTREGLEPLQAVGLEHRGHRPIQPFDRLRGVAVRLYPVGIRALLLEQARDLPEPLRDLVVQVLGHDLP